MTDANPPRPSCPSWTVPGLVTAKAAPASGRVLYGTVQVGTDTNILNTGAVYAEFDPGKPGLVRKT